MRIRQMRQMRAAKPAGEPAETGVPAAQGAARSPRLVKRFQRLRMAASLFAVLVAVAGLVSTSAHPAKAATVRTDASDPAPSPSPVTIGGTGTFSSLQVTVNQTQNLTNQNVDVSWTGGTPTYPPSGPFYINFLQIMECWGDDPATGPASTGPDPSQCEFGGTTISSLSGTAVPSRQLAVAGVVDPLETDVPPNYTGPDVYLPFVPAGQTAPTTAYQPPALNDQDDSDYYDNADTNEVDYARTGADGTGSTYFQMQNNTESPGLGCGALVTDSSASGGTDNEPCWLVVIPRGDVEVNTQVKTGASLAQALDSSPLSATNWDQRIVFRLNFEPVTSACSIGADEVEVAGDEQPANAMSSWEAGLCAQYPDAPYSYSELSDDEARNQLPTGEPGLQFVSQPLVTPFGQTAPNVYYAPVAVDALTIAFYIQEPPGSPHAGDQELQLNLNARLVAKLLTQSYQDAVADNNPYTDVPKQNPVDLTTDPEFLALNPQYAGLNFGADNIPDVILPFGTADSYTQLWTWINGDPQARAFLNGFADNDVSDNDANFGTAGLSGMTVNPNYQGLQLPLDEFPTTDPYCQQPTAVTTVNPETPLCGIALHPYFNTMNLGTLAASQGNQGLRTQWNVSDNFGSWGSTPAEADGSIAIMALTDAASAAQYDLPTARLCGDETEPASLIGQPISAQTLDQDCVGATPAAMDLAVEDAQPSAADPSVLIPNPHSVDTFQYPLTTITYAATVPDALTTVQGQQYSQLLDYIAGPGEVTGLAPGDLAPGYAPLPAALAKQTADVATAITTYAGNSTVVVPPEPPAPPMPQALPPFPVPTLPTPGPVPTGPTKGVVTRENLPGLDLADEASTAPDPLGGIRYALLICLLLGGVAAGAGPGLLLYARRLAAAPVRPRRRRITTVLGQPASGFSSLEGK